MAEKIKDISIYKLSIRLKKPFVISLGPITHAENIIVKITTDKGLVGFGECSPFMTINGENQDTAFIVGQLLAKKLQGKIVNEAQKNLDAMNEVIYGNSSIKSAFDIAMLDASAQEAGLPLYKYLGGKKNKKIITDYTVSLGSAEQMAKDALLIKEKGYKVIKVKLGTTFKEDVNRIRAIRDVVGKKIDLRIDANQGWDVQTAINVLNALEKYNIQYCEEPIARWDYMSLKKVKNKSRIPVMADESCCDHHDAERLIGLKCCDMFNLKLGKSSGITNALKIIRLADKAGIDMQVGGFMESKIGMTANAHLALTSKNIRYYDFDTPLMFAEDPVTDGIEYKENGLIEVPETPGLGASISEERLNKLEHIKL